MYDIIIVNYNSTKYAIKCIESIYRIKGRRSVNIVIIDNCSEDLPNIIKQKYPDTKYVANRANLGFAKAANIGMNLTSAEFVLLLNPDAILMDGFFDSIYDYSLNNKRVAISGPLIYEQNGSVQGSARKFPSVLTSIFGRKSPLTKLFPNNAFTKKEFICFNSNGKDPMDADWLSGACMLIRREAFVAVGGFDEKFFLYWEDADLCKRLKVLGWRIVYYPKAAIMHFVGKSSNTQPVVSICHFHNSCFRYFTRHTRGFKKAFVPAAFMCLSLRCLFVISLNLLKRIFADRINILLRSMRSEYNDIGKLVNTSLTATYRYFLPCHLPVTIQSLQSSSHFPANTGNGELDGVQFGKRNTDKNKIKKIVNMDEKAVPNKKYKILRVISRLNIGGPSIHVVLLSKGLNANLFETIVAVGSKSIYEGDMNYLLSSFNGKYYKIQELQREISPIKDIKSFLRLLLIVLKEKPDIVHTHMAKAGAIARTTVWILNTFRFNKTKVVHTFHGHVLEGYFSKVKSFAFKLIERILAQGTDAIIAISLTQKYELSEKYKICQPNKVHTIPLGFDLSKFVDARNYSGEIRNKIGANDTYLIGIVGRLTAIKNHYMFINTAKILIDRCETLPLKFLIIGDGELQQCLKKYSKSLGLQNKIIFYGWEKDIQKVYADLDILALTSMNEGTPVSIIEAMASEVPVITTGVGGVKDLLGDFDPNQNGYKGFRLCERGILCPKNEPTIFADGIEYMINSRVDRNHPMVKKARLHVLNNYSEKKLISNMESLYLHLLK